MSGNWFDVDRSGLRQMMEGKPKAWILRELVANAFDEKITQCTVNARWVKGIATIEVEDDSPEGFKRLSDAFTLFASTEKRANPLQRGRFNMGEKQILALAEEATIVSTKGTVCFDRDGRHSKSKHTDVGSLIQLFVRMLKSEFDDMILSAADYIAPSGVRYVVNGQLAAAPETLREIAVASLPTEMLVEGQWRRTTRNTTLKIYQPDWLPPTKGMLYEMGIPIQEITCPYDVDVQQKVPLSIDRDTVSESYLKRIYAEVLNVMHAEATVQSDCSAAWIRLGMASEKIEPEATRSIITARYGDKVVVARPGENRNSIDDAISQGYTVVRGSQMSVGEWANVREAQAIPPAGQLFPHESVPGITIQNLTPGMTRVLRLTQKVGSLCFGFVPKVRFSKFPGNVAAQYGDETVTFNVQNLGETWFDGELNFILDLILHELAHSEGLHVEHGYHGALTRAAGQLIVKALEAPEWFDVGEPFSTSKFLQEHGDDEARRELMGTND